MFDPYWPIGVHGREGIAASGAREGNARRDAEEAAMMDGWGGYGGGWMGFGFFFMAAFWVLVALGIVALLRWLSAPSGGQAGERGKTPLEIVQERYARGDIGREEYEQKKRDLSPPAGGQQGPGG